MNVILNTDNFAYKYCSPDGRDIRIIDNSHNYEIPFRTNSWNYKGISNLVAFVPILTKGSSPYTKTLWIYYNNLSAEFASTNLKENIQHPDAFIHYKFPVPIYNSHKPTYSGSTSTDVTGVLNDKVDGA